MIMNRGKSEIMKIMQGIGELPYYAGIGNGSGALTNTRTTLFAESGTRKLLTGSPDTTLLNKATYIYNYSVLQMSGLALREFGTFTASTAGSMWSAENFLAITFTGRNELEIQNTYQVF